MFFNLETNERLSISSQSFSGTDKNKNGSSKGVVFPLACNKSVSNTLNISSIIDHHNDDICLIKHTEARLATADVDKNKVDYLETKCVSFEYNLEQSKFNTLLDIKNISVYESKNMILEPLKEKAYEYINVISNQALTPFFCIDKEAITEKRYEFKQDFSFPPITTKNGFDLLLTKKDEKIIDEIIEEFLQYIDTISKSNKQQLDKIISYSLNAFYGENKIDKILSSKVLGQEINSKLKKEKKLLNNQTFKEALVNEIIDIITSYDIGLLETR